MNKPEAVSSKNNSHDSYTDNAPNAPYQEVMRYLGYEGTHVEETLDAGIKIIEHTPHGDIVSTVGEVSDDSRPVKTNDEEKTAFDSLSPEAKSLYFLLKKQGRLP